MSRLLIIVALIVATFAGLLLSRWLFPVPGQSDAGGSLALPRSSAANSDSGGTAQTVDAAASANGEAPSGHARSITLAVGDQRPPFRHGRTDGSIVTMDDFNGQVVLVNFWAPWCEPCREEMPLLQSLAGEWRSRGFTVVGIALDDVARVRTFVDEYAIEYPILVGGPDVIETSRLWGNRTGALPYSVLVDTEGIVRWIKLGPVDAAELREQVLAVLGS